jgi:hypothetical protein
MGDALDSPSACEKLYYYTVYTKVSIWACNLSANRMRKRLCFMTGCIAVNDIESSKEGRVSGL